MITAKQAHAVTKESRNPADLSDVLTFFIQAAVNERRPMTYFFIPAGYSRDAVVKYLLSLEYEVAIINGGHIQISW